VHGNDTTNNQIAISFNPGVANFSLRQVYSTIVNSPSFENISSDLGWVTRFWGLQQESGPTWTYEYVVGEFVLLSGNKPDGFVQANYNLQTGEVTIDYESGLISSCPAKVSSSLNFFLDKPSPAYYVTGEPVKITYSAVDDVVANMLVSSATSCLGNFTILQGFGTTGPVVYDSTEHEGCSGAPLSVTLGQGQSYNQTRVWNQTDDAGNQVPPGAYEVMGTFAGSPENYSMPVGVVYVGMPLMPVNSSILQQQFTYAGYVSNSYASPGEPIKVVWYLTNNGQQVYDLETSACSYSYKILNLTNAIIFDSANHTSCDSHLQSNPSPPMGGVSQIAYWNQTDNSGAAVSSGFYRAVLDMHIWSAGHEFNLTVDSDFETTATGTPSSSNELISIESSSLCPENCGGNNSGPYLQSSVYANGNLKSLTLYLNGTLVGRRNYNQTCGQLTCVFIFDTPIDNSSVHLVPGVPYDIVFVGTFQDGTTSISWANPLNPA
jgi:hypothetical protein